MGIQPNDIIFNAFPSLKPLDSRHQNFGQLRFRSICVRTFCLFDLCDETLRIATLCVVSHAFARLAYLWRLPNLHQPAVSDHLCTYLYIKVRYLG